MRAVLHALGCWMIGNTTTAAGHLSASVFFVAFLYFAIFVRRLLAEKTHETIHEHLYELFLRLVSAFPPLMFLFAEGVGCLSR